MHIQPYLNFNGQCEEAFKLYEQVLGGKIQGMFRFGQMPPGEPVPEGWADKIMHVGMQIDGQMILGCDAPPQYQSQMKGFAVNLSLESEAEAERIYKALSEGGQVHMPLTETFWAKRFAMFSDRFGAPWMINVSKPM